MLGMSTMSTRNMWIRSTIMGIQSNFGEYNRDIMDYIIGYTVILCVYIYIYVMYCVCTLHLGLSFKMRDNPISQLIAVHFGENDDHVWDVESAGHIIISWNQKKMASQFVKTPIYNCWFWMVISAMGKCGFHNSSIFIICKKCVWCTPVTFQESHRHIFWCTPFRWSTSRRSEIGCWPVV